MSVDERKLVTVLFADLVGSTELGSGEDPERTRALLDRFYDTMAGEIAAPGGTVEKFAGDAVMAVFGAPASQEDHAERALHAALSMRRRLAELFGDRLQLRFGVNTGEVVVGRPREGSSFVTGDAVNVAARLEQAADPGEILAGERTVAAAAGAFEFGDPGVVEAKGKVGGVRCRRLVRPLTLMRPRGVSGLRRAFVGRDAELERLLQEYRSVVRTGESRLVTILGDAGVGKTRLVRELWEALGAESPEPLRRTGRCLAYGRGITYWPLREILHEQFGILEGESTEEVLRRLAGREILGLVLGLDVAGDLHPLAARDRLRDAWAELLSDLARERPLVVLIEDLHWAESDLLDLLERLVLDVDAPVLLLATARPELLDGRPAWGGARSSGSLIQLDPLTSGDASRLVADLLEVELPEPVLRLVVERAEGNPFFVEEVLGALIDEGVLEHTGGTWSARQLPEDLVVPDSVHAVVAARIDLLPPAEKRALQAASVIGRIFWAGPVRELLEGDDPDFDLLEDRDFVRRRPGSSLAGEREYAVKHAVTREVAYGSITKARRARLHAGFAEWLERTGQGRDELTALVAHHYAEAVRPEDADLAWGNAEPELERLRRAALRWLVPAAEAALQRYELVDALGLLERARELAPAGPERAAVWRRIARAHALRYAGEEFWTATQAAIAETTDPEAEAELYADLAYESTTRSGIWKQMPAPGVVEGWIERALVGAEPGSAERAKGLIARARWNPAKGADAAVEASAIAEALGDAELRSAAWDARGITAFVAGEYDHGRAWAERRFDLLDEISDPDLRADIYSAPISGCIWSGRFKEARRLAHAHDEIASTLTPHHRVHGVAVEIEVEERLGGWETIRRLQQRAEADVAANLDTPCVRNPRALLVCALANEYVGAAGEAERLEQRAREVWMEGYGATLDTPLLELALARSDLDEVARLVAEPDVARGWHRGWFVFARLATRFDGLAALRDRAVLEAEAEPYLRRRSYLQPFAQRALGVVREDETLIRDARATFESFGLDWHAAQTRRVLGG